MNDAAGWLTRCSNERARKNERHWSISVPAVLRSFADPSALLPGEDRRDFEAICQMMIDDIKPETIWSGFGYSILSSCLGKSCASQIKDPSGFSRGAGMPEYALQNMRLQTMRNVLREINSRHDSVLSARVCPFGKTR